MSAGLQTLATGTVSTLGLPVSNPTANAETITKALLGNSTVGRDAILGAAQTGFFTYSEPSCGNVGGGSPDIGQAVVGAGLGSVPVVGGFLKTVFGAFTGHHKQAVATEKATLCRAVPDANNFLRSIDAQVATGQLDAAGATDAMEQAFQQWRGTEIAAIVKDSGGKCNAACVYEKCFRAAIEKRKLDYAASGVQSMRGASGVIGGVVNLVTGAVGQVEALASGLLGGDPVGAAAGSQSSVVQSGIFPTQNSGVLGFVLIGGLLLVALVGSKKLFGGKNK